MRKDNSVLLLGLVDQLVENAILVDLKSASFNLAVLLRVRVSADIGNLASLLSLSGKLLLLLGRSYLLLFFPLKAKVLLSLLFHLLLELFNLELLILEHSVGEIAEAAVHFLINS